MLIVPENIGQSVYEIEKRESSWKLQRIKRFHILFSYAELVRNFETPYSIVTY
jgi:hypothetical protein